MADALLSAVLNTVLRQIAALCLEEFKLNWGLKTELERLQSTLTTFQAVLMDAEKKQWKSEAIKDWLRKLKDAASELDDMLEEFSTKTHLQRDSKSQVSTLFCFPKQILIRSKMGHKLKNIREKLDSISGERLKFHLREGIVEEIDREFKPTSSLLIESVVYGREKELGNIITLVLNNLTNPNGISVYTICGMKGLGKTTLAQLVFNDTSIKKAFDLTIWVSVSQDFHIIRLTKAILESINGENCSMQELDPLQRHLQEKLTGKRFLLVLDDVWNEDYRNWEELKKALIHGAKGSTVLVTTCNEVVARMMTTVPNPIHHLGFLSDDDSWSLFKQRVLLFKGKREDCPQFEALGKEIVKKCGGVPLAVKVLGSFMCYREKENDWISIKQSKMWEMPNVGSTVLEVLRLSYENMKPHLRQCFAFCSIFPKGSIMRRDKLIQLWMANGFIPSIGQVNLHDAGCEIFNELTWRSFLQEIKENLEGNVTCKMHDLIHDLAQSIMGSECCVIEPRQPELNLKVTKTVRHVFASRNSSEIATANVHKLANVKSLRSLIVHNNFFSKIATKQKHLKALEFHLDGKMKIPIGNFRHLRYLNLTHPCIMTLPESISSLHNLQTLNLRCSRLRTLPKGLKHLKNLIYLDIKGCHALTCMPSGLGQLSCLRVLSKFIVGKESGCYIDELRGLALEGELCIEQLDHVKCSRDAQSANLSMKQNLRSISLHWRKKNDGDKLQNADDHQEVLTGLQPHPNLKKLSIKNFHGPRFSNWLMDLLVPKLVEISLVNCERCESLPPLGKLVFLKVLSINGMDALKSIEKSFYGDGQSSFPSLERLSFRGMPYLEEWTTANGKESFASLGSLIIGHCPKLVELPMFPSLKTLQIEENCSVSLLTSVKHYTSLNSLSIGGFHDQLPTMPDGLLQNHNQLEELFIHLRKLNSLSNLLDNLSSLRRLDLQMCQELQSLPAGLKNLSSLKSLHLSDCDSLDTLPENGLQGLSSLSSLWVQNCKNLVHLSNGVSHLASLRDLFIFSCPKLISLPDSIQHLSAVRSLKIWDCEGLTCLPNEIEHLSSLSLLEIRRCPNLTSLPQGLQSLKDLRNLTIIGCPHVEKWYKKEKRGKDSSSYIAHIPSIRIMSSEEFSKRRRSSGKLLLC